MSERKLEKLAGFILAAVLPDGTFRIPASEIERLSIPVRKGVA